MRCYAVARGLGLDFSNLDFSQFPGFNDAKTKLFEDNFRIIFEDYAHHPTEIRSFLEQRRRLLPEYLMKVGFSAASFFPTSSLGKLFAEELGQADEFCPLTLPSKSSVHLVQWSP